MSPSPQPPLVSGRFPLPEDAVGSEADPAGSSCNFLSLAMSGVETITALAPGYLRSLIHALTALHTLRELCKRDKFLPKPSRSPRPYLRTNTVSYSRKASITTSPPVYSTGRSIPHADEGLKLLLYHLLGKYREACVVTLEMIEERLLEKIKILRLQSTRFLGFPPIPWGQWSSKESC